MSGSAVVGCKKALIDLLEVRPNLEGVQIAYGWPGDDQAEAERIFTGSARGDTPDSKLTAGRRVRQENGTFDVVIQVAVEAGTIEEAEDRALELGVELEECVADNKYLAGKVPQLIFAGVESWRLRYMYNDQGSLAELTYTIRFKARLT